jgi:hypothetical protein
MFIYELRRAHEEIFETIDPDQFATARDLRDLLLFITAGMVAERKPCVRGEKE